MTMARWALRSVLGLAAVMTTVSAAKADPQAAQAETRGATVATQRMSEQGAEHAVLDQFADLTADATQARMEELTSDPALSGHFSAVATKLATPGTVAADIEQSVLPLVEGRTEEDAELTLAAIMLNQYQSTLRAGLVEGGRQPADVAQILVDRDTLLTTAAYGRTRRHHSASSRRVRRQTRR